MITPNIFVWKITTSVRYVWRRKEGTHQTWSGLEEWGLFLEMSGVFQMCHLPEDCRRELLRMGTIWHLFMDSWLDVSTLSWQLEGNTDCQNSIKLNELVSWFANIYFPCTGSKRPSDSSGQKNRVEWKNSLCVENSGLDIPIFFSPKPQNIF